MFYVTKQIKQIFKIKKQYNMSEEKKIFVKNNSKYWETSCKYEKQQGIVLMELFSETPIATESSMRIAKTIARKKHMKITSICPDKQDYIEIAKSYQVDDVIKVNAKKHALKNPHIFAKVIYYSIKIFTSIKSLEDIERIKYAEHSIGDLVYDTYIRFFSKHGYYSPRIDRVLFAIIVQSLMQVELMKIILDKLKPKYVVVFDTCTTGMGLLARVSLNAGFKTVVGYPYPKFLVKDKGRDYIGLNKEEILSKIGKEDFPDKIEAYLEKRFSGDIENHDIKSAYYNKRIYSKRELEKICKLDTNKKTAIIMPHCFSDGPHCDSMLYTDYYQWLLAILKMAENNCNVNWLIKPHPSSFIYGEEGVVEKILKDLKIKNVVLVPNDMSTACIKDIVDVVFTVRGTITLELACFGIPSINAGQSPYSPYGFTIEPKNREEYKQIIDNIDKISKLEKRDIDCAKLILCYTHIFLYENFIKDQNYIYKRTVFAEGTTKQYKPDDIFLDINEYNKNCSEKENIFYRITSELVKE